MTATKQEDSKQGLYFGGVPTEPEVRRLRDEYPDASLTPGSTIDYAEVAELIHSPARSHRFNTVCHRWRRQVEQETGTIIGADKGKFIVLDDPDKADLAGAKLRHAVRSARRSATVACRVDRKRLDEPGRDRLDHVTMIAARLQETARLASRTQLPRLTEQQA